MIEVGAPKATKTLYGSRFSAVLGKTSIDNPLSDSVFRHLFRIVQAMQATLPGSSVAEQVTVNHLVVGSIPTRAAIFHQGDAGFLDFPEKSTVRLLSVIWFRTSGAQPGPCTSANSV